MLLRRRLMCLKSKTNPVQHYDEDGNAYDVLDVGISLGIQLSDDLDRDTDALGLNLSVALSNDLDKDSTALGINVSIALEAA